MTRTTANDRMIQNIVCERMWKVPIPNDKVGCVYCVRELGLLIEH